MAKERPIYKVLIEKVLKDTGKVGSPFWSKTAEHKRVWLFGILIKQVSTVGDFPDPEDKK